MPRNPWVVGYFSAVGRLLLSVALAYVATHGRLCGPRLQQALRDDRQAYLQSTVSDPELAVAIANQG
ncbi:DUF2388 domain-containing protein [Pseudomonas sp. NPDC089422]|uniref:DUF2388 domain-containing protein n=1 Tax=Pseudomonas sp. NPDC089422 TaxID=3364466 RepID=UPI0037F9C982